MACHHQGPTRGTGDGGNQGGDGSTAGTNDQGNCTSLRCRVNMSCSGGAHTTLTGKVYAPNGTLPLYNAAVYVPNGSPTDYTDGVTCDRCDGTLSGDPITSALTGSDGTFTLKDVPTGANIPLVVQLGRWRREVMVANVPDCATTAVEAESTRLPKNSSEGHLPMMAVATGKADPLECLLVKLGIDTNEVTIPSGTGRIHFYLGTDGSGLQMSGAPSATDLYSSLDNMKKYDVVLFPCEGEGTVNKDKVGGNTLNPDPRGLVQQYLDAGGRVFTTHYSYNWLTYKNSPYNAIAMPDDGSNKHLWPVGQPDDYDNVIAGVIDTSFPKGMDFAAWLVAAGAQSAMGTLNIKEGRSDLIGVSSLAQPWVNFDFTQDPNTQDSDGNHVTGNKAVMHMTFNTPLAPPTDDMGQPLYCGRVVYSDFHATADALANGNKNGTFPTECKTDAMSDQEKALAFMLFDLSSCVQSDQTGPIL